MSDELLLFRNKLKRNTIVVEYEEKCERFSLVRLQQGKNYDLYKLKALFSPFIHIFNSSILCFSQRWTSHRFTTPTTVSLTTIISFNFFLPDVVLLSFAGLVTTYVEIGLMVKWINVWDVFIYLQFHHLMEAFFFPFTSLSLWLGYALV